MRTNLSSFINLNKIPTRYYKPENAFERSILTRLEKLHTDIFDTTEEGALYIAKDLARAIRERQDAGKNFVLAIAGSNSPKYVCNELIRMHKEEGLSFHNVIVFNMYEFYPLSKDMQYSSMQTLRHMLLDHVDLKPENIHSIDGTMSSEDIYNFCRNYDKDIENAGGIDASLMGLSKVGSIGFNESGSTFNSITRLVLLDGISRADAAKIFGKATSVPPSAITMGMKTILSSKKIYLMAWGDEKAAILKNTVEGKITDSIPATFLQNHNNTVVAADLLAASQLTRISRPWLVSPTCEWNDKQIRSAIVWLCQKTDKPILKLTNKDYTENGLNELLAIYGLAYNVNIKIFNDLQHTITGWPGGKPNADDTYRPERAKPFPKRVVVFSPHPDDDVISMGGTVHRLAVQGHDVHIAYETSGNIAVDDEEVRRFMMFMKGYNEIAKLNSKEIDKQYAANMEFLKNKKDEISDNRDILDIKALIRRGEARTACAYAGIKSENVHFLNLPFYETGKIEKNPISEADVNIVLDLLRKIKPHQIFVAGDLADPHGTHRVCTDAVFAAIDIEKQAGAEWLKDCRIWMYRGAWAEWEIENIEMAVPMSPEELRIKRNTILKHQSQMESAPFLGNDERLFWQRSEDRNHATAELYHKLGLASYEAIEAFVEYHPI